MSDPGSQPPEGEVAMSSAPAGWAQVRAPDGSGLTLNIEYERCFRRPVWPAEEGAPVASQHLDIHVDDLAAAVRRAESCRARQARHQPQTRVRAMIDPDGHPFCLFL
jgi:hypothetical protein